MWNFFMGYFLGQSSNSNDKSGCSSIFVGLIGLFVIFYAVKWTAATDSYLSQAAKNRSFLAVLLYPYLFQQIHHLTGSAALWLSLLSMIAGAFCITTLYSYQLKRQQMGLKPHGLIMMIFRMYFYLMIAYQTIYGGKILWESSLFKTVGWYLLGIIIISSVWSYNKDKLKVKSPASTPSSAEPVDSSKINQPMFNPEQLGLIRVGPEKLLVNGEDLTADRFNTRHLRLFGATIIQRQDINNGCLTICELEQGKAFENAGIHTAYLLKSIANMDRNLSLSDKAMDMEGLMLLQENTKIGDRLEVTVIIGYDTEHRREMTYSVTIESHIREVK